MNRREFIQAAAATGALAACPSFVKAAEPEAFGYSEHPAGKQWAEHGQWWMDTTADRLSFWYKGKWRSVRLRDVVEKDDVTASINECKARIDREEV